MRVAAVLFTSPPESLAPFAEACLRFSPQLCLKRPGAIFIEIGKCKTLYREETFLARLKILLERFGLTARVALGDTLLEALLLAVHGTISNESLTTRCFYECLDPFQSDSTARRTAEKLVDNLAQVGVTTVQGFLAIPAAELTPRFGAAGLMIRARLLHELEVGWPLWIPEERVKERLELFDSDQCSEVEPLLFYLKPVLDRAFSRLWGRGLRASAVRLKLSLEKFSTVI